MPAAALPFAFARDHGIAAENGTLLLGPEASAEALLDARRRLGPLSRVERLDSETFRSALTRLYGADADAGSAESTDAGGDTVFELEDTPGASDVVDLLEDASEAPVIQLVNTLIKRAIQSQGSDLHIEPQDGGLRVRMRIDGALQTIMDRSDVPVRRVISRLKVMAQLDISETRLPQDGRIAIRLGARAVDLRVSTLPGNFGERVVMRILDRSASLLPLAELGLSEAQITQLERLVGRPNGIILATGATGSGKTTTLYSLLSLANTEERNIVTVEDPVEYNLPGVSQSQINAQIGMTFAKGLRATLRQDPDVILVGEIRDEETASVAAQAALTGHLVFSSLHTNSTLGAITRLRDLGLENYLIGATVQGIIAQRLLRRLCPDCAAQEPPSASDAPLFEAANLPLPRTLPAARGCDSCRGTGMKGRFGLFDILEITPPLRAKITDNANEMALSETGANTLLNEALQAVLAGKTTTGEVRRVLGDIL